jgi:cyclophilin family peptidyl-prolyl cis-trans isomerase
MYRKLLILIIAAAVLIPVNGLAFPENKTGQVITNVDLQIQGSRIAVKYDLGGTENVEVQLRFVDGENLIDVKPESLKGDIGSNIKPGKGKTVFWDFLKQYPYGLSSQKLVPQLRAVAMTSEVKEEPTTEKKEGKVKVSIKTSMGEIIAELDSEKAPISVENFIKYANNGFFDGTIFHRVIDGFMIQGGGFTPEMAQKDTMATIKNEADNGLFNERGTLAMARTSVVDSATAQFFVNLVNNGFLNHRDKSVSGYGYAVFGKVVDGMDVVDAIAKVETGNVKGLGDVPLEAVVMESVTVLE